MVWLPDLSSLQFIQIEPPPQFPPNDHRSVTTENRRARKLDSGELVNERKTFVIWISREAIAGSDRFILEGRIEQVDTGVQRKFRSSEELVSILESSLASRQSDSTGS